MMRWVGMLVWMGLGAGMASAQQPTTTIDFVQYGYRSNGQDYIDWHTTWANVLGTKAEQMQIYLNAVYISNYRTVGTKIIPAYTSPEHAGPSGNLYGENLIDIGSLLSAYQPTNIWDHATYTYTIYSNIIESGTTVVYLSAKKQTTGLLYMRP